MRFLQHRFFLIFAIATLGYWSVAPLLGGPFLIEVTNGLVVGSFIAFCISWFRTVWGSFKRGGEEGADQLKVGLFLAFFSLGVSNRVWASIVRWGEYDASLTSNPILGYILLLAAIGGYLCISAPGSVEGSMPVHNRNWIIAAVGAGMLFAGFMFGTAWNRIEVTPNGIVLTADSVRPTCPAEAPIKISETNIIHDPSSIWYAGLTPKWCYKTVRDAQESGYRLPRITMLR